MSARLKLGVAIAVLVVVFALTWFFYFPHSPLGEQMTNLKLAEEHRPKVEESLRRTVGAERVRVSVYTGHGGSLSVSGDVADEPTAAKVQAAVLATDPPVTVWFLLTVGETNLIKNAVEPPRRGI